MELDGPLALFTHFFFFSHLGFSLVSACGSLHSSTLCLRISSHLFPIHFSIRLSICPSSCPHSVRPSFSLSLFSFSTPVQSPLILCVLCWSWASVSPSVPAYLPRDRKVVHGHPIALLSPFWGLYPQVPNCETAVSPLSLLTPFIGPSLFRCCLFL